MSEVLYRKYRPKRFADIVDQQQIVKILRQSVASNNIAHAYLFCGPRGTGKTSTARIFATAINCLNFDQTNKDLCGVCEHCTANFSGQFLDTIEIDAASNRGINEMREIKERVNFAPVQGKYKVYIIDEVHMLTKEAFNAILKTLEEPPANTIFILATTEPHKLLATIISRVVRLDFRLANIDSLSAKLNLICKSEGIEIEEPAIAKITLLAKGSFRDAESLLEKIVGSLGSTKQKRILTAKDVESSLGIMPEAEVVAITENIVSNGDLDVLKKMDQFVAQGFSINYFVEELQRTLLNQLLEQSSREESNIGIKVRLMKLLAELQDWQVNYSHYADPLIALKISLLKALSGDAAIKVSTESANGAKWQPTSMSAKISGKALPTEGSEVLVTQVVQIEDLTSERSEVNAEERTALNSSNQPSPQLTSEVLSALRAQLKDSIALAALVNSIALEESAADKYLLKVPSKFHQLKLNKPSNKQIIQTKLNAILNKDVSIEVVIDQSISKKVATPSKAKSDNTQIVEEIFHDMIS